GGVVAVACGPAGGGAGLALGGTPRDPPEPVLRLVEIEPDLVRYPRDDRALARELELGRELVRLVVQCAPAEAAQIGDHERGDEREDRDRGEDHDHGEATIAYAHHPPAGACA